MNFSLSSNVRRLFVASAAFIAVSVAPAHSQTMRMDALLSVLPGGSHAPFGLSVSPAPAGPMWIKWREFETGLNQSVEAVARCRAEPLTCSRAETRLIALIDMAHNAEGRAKFGLVNREINLSIAYTSDAEQHGSADIWSSALDSLASGQGDCEDFAITKYVTLREAGVPASDLRVLVGRVRNTQGSAHAVLAARVDSRWLILDNRRMALLEDASADLQPIFAFDDKGVSQFGGPAPAIAVAAQETVHDITRANVTPADMRPASGGNMLAFAETLPLLM